MHREIIRYVYWELSNYCNLRCKHCFAISSSDASTIADQSRLFKTVKRFIERSSVVPPIRFGGGEPLLVPYLPELVEYCTNLGINVDVTTNGTLLNESMANALKLAGLRELTISVEGSKGNNDDIRGAGSFQKIETSLRVGMESGLRLSVASTITKLNHGGIREFVEMCSSYGIKKIYFFRYCGSNNRDELMLSRDELAVASRAICQARLSHPDVRIICESAGFYTFLWDGKLRHDGCNFRDGVITVKYNGDIVVCAAIDKKLGNIYESSVDDVLNAIKAEQSLMSRIPSECGFCAYADACRGGCKEGGFRTGGEYSKRDPLCLRGYHDDV